MKSSKITTLNTSLDPNKMTQRTVKAKEYNELKDDFDALRPSDTAINADTISEVTEDTGVTIDSVLLKDSTVTASGLVLTTAYGTAGSGVTAVERGDGRNITVTLSFTAQSLGTPTAGGNSAHGKLIYTFPDSTILVTAIACKIGLTIGTVTTDTPDVGLGTAIGTGAQALLSGVGATAEDIITGQTWPGTLDGSYDYFGTLNNGVVTDATTFPLIKADGTGTPLYLNAADGWAAGVTGNLTATGYIVINYIFVV